MSEIEFTDDVENALKVLKQGGIILYPTDTIWGLGCDATNEEAVKKIMQVKQRPSEKSFVVLVASEKDILLYTAVPDLAVFDYLQLTNKPTTVIYEHALGLAESVCAKDGSVAIRICSEKFCNHLLNRFKKPIVSTSANISGEKSPENFSKISNIIKQNVDYIVQYKQQDAALNSPSSIIRWKNGKTEVIRP